MNQENVIFICISFLLVLYPVSSEFTVTLSPSEGPVLRYVGENLTLTCNVSDKTSPTHSPMPATTTTSVYHLFDSKYLHINSINWIIPTNAENRVEIRTENGIDSVTIYNLQETDGGQYTCNIIDALSNADSIKASILVIVKPRGVASPCVQNSFPCSAGLCIPQRYKCDGVADCLDGSDERVHNCGPDTCKNKLKCDDGRCLDSSICCRESNLSPKNCTIRANIQCCRQLIHPALLDMDLYYLATKRDVETRWQYKFDMTIMIGCLIILFKILTISVFLALKCSKWKSRRSQNNQDYRWSIFRLRPIADNPTEQCALGSTQFYSSHLSARDLLSSDLLRTQTSSRNSRGLVLLPLTSSQPNHDPPPSYHQVVGAPPPPYSSRDNLALGNTAVTMPLLSPITDSDTNSVMSSINSHATTELLLPPSSDRSNTHHNFGRNISVLGNISENSASSISSDAVHSSDSGFGRYFK